MIEWIKDKFESIVCFMFVFFIICFAVAGAILGHSIGNSVGLFIGLALGIGSGFLLGIFVFGFIATIMHISDVCEFLYKKIEEVREEISKLPR